MCHGIFPPWHFYNLSVKFYNHVQENSLYWGGSFNTVQRKGWKAITSNQKQRGALQSAGCNYWDGNV